MNPVKIIQSIPAQVTLIAVSKTRSIEEIHEMAKLGISTFGENRVQELKQKYDPAYHWHMIGHLQRNKVKDVVPLADMIQSLDSLPRAEENEKQCAKIDKVMDVLIEVNSSKEASKSGVAPEEALSFLAVCMSFPHLRVRGLMTIGPNIDDQEQIKACFTSVYQLYQEAQARWPQIDTLSMGMSGDYEIAIACGANMIRLGTILFGERN